MHMFFVSASALASRKPNAKYPLALGRTVWLCIVLFQLFESPAHAYVDPGSGSLLLQMLMMAFLGGLFYVRKLIRLVRPIKRENVGENESDETGSSQ